MLLWAWEWAPCCNWERAVCMLIWSLREGWSVWAVRLSYSFLSWSFFLSILLVFTMIFKAPLPRLGFRVILSSLLTPFVTILLSFLPQNCSLICSNMRILLSCSHCSDPIYLVNLFFLFRYWPPPPVSLCPGFGCPDCCKGLVLYCQVRPLHSYSFPASCFLFPVFCGWAKGSPSIVSFHYVAVWTMSFHRGKWITINSDRSMFLTFIYYSYYSWMNMAFD